VGIQITGAQRAIAMLKGVADRAKDPGPVLAELASEMRAMVDASFATDTAPDGTPWAPRSQAYRFADGRPARTRTERSPGRGLLESSGALRSSISVNVVGTSIVAEASSSHAAFQQFGTRYMPARSFLPLARGGPMTGGAAGAWFAAIPARIATYVARGTL
jgi:phage gpG-like protein